MKHKVNSFTEWRGRALMLYAALARRCRPDTFAVVHEPSIMASRMGEKVKVSDWIQFVRRTTKVVKKNSPTSRIGAGSLSSEREYFDAFERLPEVEVLTLDMYGIKELRSYNRMIRSAKAPRKPVYIEETWRQPYLKPQPGMTPDAVSLKNVGNLKFRELDSRWIRVMTAYAQANRLEAISPVWMFALFSYVDGDGDLNDPAYNRSAIEAIRRDERTATFRSQQEVVRENRHLRR